MSEITKSEEKPIDEMRILEIAEKMKVLILFAADLIPDLDVLEKLVKDSGDKESFIDSAFPIITALGQDADLKRMEWTVRHERSKAVFNLVKTLDETEKQRNELLVNKSKRQDIFNLMGI